MIREELRQLPVWMQFCLACLLVVAELLVVAAFMVYLMGGQ